MVFTWTTRALWIGGRVTTVYARNHAFPVGPAASFRAVDAHLSAVEYLLGAFAADLIDNFQMRSSRAQVRVDALELAMSGSLGNALLSLGVIGEEGNAGFSQIDGTLYVSAEAEEAVLQEVWRGTLQQSPIYNTLKHCVMLNLELRIMM